MKGRIWKASAAELKRAATYTEADQECIRQAARAHSGALFDAVLNAERRTGRRRVSEPKVSDHPYCVGAYPDRYCPA